MRTLLLFLSLNLGPRKGWVVSTRDRRLLDGAVGTHLDDDDVDEDDDDDVGPAAFCIDIVLCFRATTHRRVRRGWIETRLLRPAVHPTVRLLS